MTKTSLESVESNLLPGTRRWERFWNTYVRLPLPRWGRQTARYWASQAVDGPHGPEKFVALQAASHVLVDEVAVRLSGPAAPVLDLGCNVGRHMDALFRRGFTNLHGVDVQDAAIEHMGRVFPQMKATAQVHLKTFQDYLPTVEDRFFEVVFTLGATVELVSPGFPICRELARISRKAVVLAINEGGHSFPRLWEEEFSRCGFFLTKLLRPACPGEPVSLMVFRPVE